MLLYIFDVNIGIYTKADEYFIRKVKILQIGCDTYS